MTLEHESLEEIENNVTVEKRKLKVHYIEGFENNADAKYNF